MNMIFELIGLLHGSYFWVGNFYCHPEVGYLY